MSIEQAQAKLFTGLQGLSPAISIKEADNIASGFFPQLDAIARVGNDDFNKVSEVALDYARGLFELKNGGDGATKSDIKSLREQASNALIEADMSAPAKAFDGIDYAIPVKAKPTEPSAGEVDAATIDTGEIQYITEAQADKSADLAKSKMIADSMNPLQELIESVSPKEQFDFLQEFSKILDANKGEAGEVSEADLKAIKGQVGELVKNYSPEALEKFLKNLKNLSPELNFEFSNYFNKMLKPALEGGKALVEAGAHINNKFKPDLVKVLVRNINLLGASIEKPDSETDLGRIQAKKEFIATKLVESSKELEVKLSQALNYNVKAHFQRTIDSISAELKGNGQKLYASDLSLLAKHLDDTKNISQDKQKTDLMAFLQKNSKMALMALPMILGPLASALSMIPIIGKPLARLAPGINQLATQFGPYMFTMFMNSGDSNDSQAAQKQAPESKTLAA